jgi:NAD(P)-dependent dehydrogenase (short-subunit alcohol dehydrogenase family)
MAGKVALVTGANTGIGLAIAERLLVDGYVLGYATAAADDAAKAQCEAFRTTYGDDNVVWVSGDLADPAVPEQLVAATVRDAGRVDVLVNNAGIVTAKPVLDLTAAEFDLTFAVDVRASFLLAQAVARQMTDGGSIVNITSVHEHIPLPGSAAYCASKGGLGLLTKVMALELGERGIRVNAVAPGEIATPMTGQHDEDPGKTERPALPLKRPGHADEVGRVVAFLCTGDSSYMTGASIVVDGGLMLIAAAANMAAA